jgi:hypothetical protein
VGATDHTRAKQSVDLAMTNLSNHLHNLGHGSFAFIITDSEGGSAHAWTAVNHNGTILFLDPQTRRISETVPLYQNRGAPSEANVVAMDALVVDSGGQYSPLPFHRAGIWSHSALEPTGTDPAGSGSDQDRRIPVADSDRHDPPGFGYFADLYEQFEPKAIERRLFAEMPSEMQTIFRQSIEACEDIADRAQSDLESALESLSGFGHLDRPRLVGTEYRVKTGASLARAYMVERDDEPDLRTFLNNQKDRVRFSVEVPLHGYEEAVSATLAALQASGYEVGRIVNFWSEQGRHNGLNVAVTDSTGFQMEVQFPTRLTGAIGKATHSYYEVIRLSDLPSELRVDAFLRILAINNKYEIARHQPAGLRSLGSPRPVDSTISRWLDREPLIRREYAEWLRLHRLSWADMLARHRLRSEDIAGADGSERT